VLDEDGNVIPAELSGMGSVDGDQAEGHRTDIANRDIRVSTVFLGLNHRYDPEGPALRFETMVFGPTKDRRKTIRGMPEPNPLDYQERNTTLAQAKEGHARAVKWAKKEIMSDKWGIG
jgi:hypothetical protein